MILVRHAAHKSAFELPARDDVHHRHLLRDAQGLAAMRDRIAEYQEPRARGLACEDAGHDGHGGHGAGGCLVVLVHHDLEAELVGEAPVVEPFAVDVTALDRIVVPVRKPDADHLEALFVGLVDVGVGRLAEMIDLQGTLFRSLPRRVDCAGEGVTGKVE